MEKFGRNYELTIEPKDPGDLPVIVRLPFTIEFDITRNTLTSANVCQVRVYNLSQENRNRIRFNQTDYGHFQSITLRAGYGTNLATVFTGNISQAWSVREGVNFITQIECYDGGFAFVNGVTNNQFPAGTPERSVIQSTLGNLPGVKIGAISPNYSGTIPRGNTYSGNSANILKDQLVGDAFFIDNGKANVLGTNEYISDLGGVTVINNQSGLLQTPVLEKSIVRFDMLFEPNLQVAQKIRLESITENNFNGEYKVTGVKHRGMISGAVAGAVITTGEFFFTKLLTPVSSHG